MLKAERLIDEYVKKFQEQFGELNMSYNIHILQHFCDTVQNGGPIWANLAFCFEAWNSRIIKSITSSNGRELQIITKFLMSKFVDRAVENPLTSEETKTFIKELHLISQNIH